MYACMYACVRGRVRACVCVRMHRLCRPMYTCIQKMDGCMHNVVVCVCSCVCVCGGGICAVERHIVFHQPEMLQFKWCSVLILSIKSPLLAYPIVSNIRNIT